MATKLYINGEWVEATGGSFETRNPATEELIAEVGKASTADLDAAVEAAQAAFENPEWREQS
jgi:acyl-CoA reductase-like NAD-dependent aldehyde dehydrogenase